MMPEDVLEIMIKKALVYADGSCTFGFQGGEPTLRGLDFFRRAVELQKKHNVKGVRIENALQTNGLLLNEEWARFLAEERVLVGLSIDGMAGIHNKNRPDARGDGMEVVDSGVPVLSMHAPQEIINKADLYEAFKGYAAFLKDAE